ncbi:MAG TPA: 3-deoxy-D-manno-octulosonic acid transferase, partial [Xanthomonadales bacterium]|nr:3-deoxy-D-manno-octulosonic acid transferase [Xanthomonadales bacterium]
GAALRVADAAELEAALLRLCADPDQRDRMGQSGARLVRSGQGAVDRTLELIEAQLTPTAG